MEIKVLLLRARLKPVAQLQIALFTFSLLLTFFLILYPRDYFFFQENNSDLKNLCIIASLCLTILHFHSVTNSPLSFNVLHVGI